MKKYTATYKLPVIINDADGDGTDVSDIRRIELIRRTADGFNNDDLAMYFSDMDKEPEIELHAFEDDDLFVDATIKDNSPEFIEKIRDFLSGQCSDGWGEGFEQHPLEINGIEYYISTWDYANDVEFIGVVEEPEND